MKIPVTLPLVLFYCYNNENTGDFTIGVVIPLVIPETFSRGRSEQGFA